MKRRFISFILVICLCTLCTVPAFAIEEIQVGVDTVSEEEILAEIAEKKAETTAIVYEQLELEGKTHMLSDYQEILFPEIEATIYAKYGMEDTSSVLSTAPQYRFTYGGTIANVTASGRNAVSTYMDRNNSYYYILSTNDLGTVVAETIVGMILGGLPKYSTIFTVLYSFATIVTPSVKTEIRDCGGYARILTLSGVDNSSVLLPWDTYPYGSPYAYDPVELLEWEVFPEFDPFEQ